MEDLFFNITDIPVHLGIPDRSAYKVGLPAVFFQLTKERKSLQKEILHCHTPRLLIVDKFLHIYEEIYQQLTDGECDNGGSLFEGSSSPS